MSRFRIVASLLLVLVLTGLVNAQTSLKVSQVGSTGAVTQVNVSKEDGPSAKAPSAGKYWDGLASTDYYNLPPYIAATPNPQIGVGPDDILTIVNRTIARYPNPNAMGGTLVTNPYNNPPTEKVWLDTWLGIANLATLCPSGTGSNSVCVIDNASVRYDQMQGRFVVLFTVTDVPAHRSNWVLIVSKYSQFTKCTTATATCPASSPLFTPPVIAPIVGGTSTGGINTANWVQYNIPINVAYATAPAEGGLTGTGIAGVVNSVTTGGATASTVTVNYCANGGPALPLTGGAGGTALACTNYFPTAARMGLDNDNIILTAPVLDQRGATAEGTLVSAAGQTMGPYVGTRVVSIAKLVVYNGTALNFNNNGQAPACTNATPIACNAVNLSDNTRTGTLTNSTAALANCAITPPAAPGVCSPIVGTNPMIPVFWEPNNLRGRALASYSAQVAPVGAQGGILTPIDYLVGNRASNDFGQNSNALGSDIFIQPIIYSCPGSAIYAGPSGVSFCGVAGGGQVPDLPLLAAPRNALNTIAGVDDPGTIGQGFSAAAMTTNPQMTPVSSTVSNRLFVGDSRPQQVMFREGLLYVARNARLVDFFFGNPLGSSTVLYDIIKTCATGAPLAACGGYSITGANIGNPALVLEAEWSNGQNVPDAGGNINGFGFYAPMFESPADVISSGPISPIALFPWFEKLFVGMTTGGTSNVANTFAKNFPSLWDYRPGDDAYDTVLPYLNPTTGTVVTTAPCPGNVTVSATAASGANVTVSSTAGLGVGMYLTSTNVGTFPATINAIAGNTVTLSSSYTGSTFPTNLTFSRTSPAVNVTATQITAGSPQITVASATGLQIGATLATTNSGNKTAAFTAATGQVTVTSTTNIAVGMNVSLRSNDYSATTIAGSNVVLLPSGSERVFVGMQVSGTGIPGGTTVAVGGINQPGGPGTPIAVTLSAAATASSPATGVTLTFGNNGAAPTFTAGTTVTAVSNTGVVTLSAAADPLLSTGPLTGCDAVGCNGATIRFEYGTSPFPAGTTIIAMSGTTITLSQAAAAGTTATNVPLTFTAVTTTCPMIPWSSRGGASTDPNDGSLWMYGQFAKNRLASVPGPGQWGTAVANYALDFPSTDVYNNDNAFYADVQPGTNAAFTWIQIAKNVGIAQSAGNGTCPANPPGNPPIQQPPAAGQTPVPGNSTLVCPTFGPTTIVTRSEMARWVVLSQMDEAQVTAYLNATGGPPSNTASSFEDTINDPNNRYIEVMYRRGYTKGCSTTVDAKRRYCPTDPITRGQMAVFLIRAKMNNVFPTTLSGIPLAAPYGDNFGLFQQTTPYFTDVATTDDFYPYIQKMRELRITNGQTATTYGSTTPLTRQEIAVFVVRAFFL